MRIAGTYIRQGAGPIIIAAWLQLSSGCASAPAVPEARETVPPPRTDVTRSQAWRDAEAVAKLDKARFTVIGAGESMRPVYGENTVLVLQKVPYESLHAGMKVAYRNKRGVVVLHQLVAEDAEGWRAVGLNNLGEDRERVTRSNLLGVVYAAFANSDVQ